MPTGPHYTGIVKFFDAERGFGFIVEDGTKEEIYFHKTGVKTPGYNPKQEDRLSYFKTPSPRHPGKMNAIAIEQTGKSGNSSTAAPVSVPRSQFGRSHAR